MRLKQNDARGSGINHDRVPPPSAIFLLKPRSAQKADGLQQPAPARTCGKGPARAKAAAWTERVPQRAPRLGAHRSRNHRSKTNGSFVGILRRLTLFTLPPPPRCLFCEGTGPIGRCCELWNLEAWPLSRRSSLSKAQEVVLGLPPTNSFRAAPT
ncbi:hypothetical protein LX32DRAFT_289833 [Colletotrichum zoysiae]|uniref:Uncharacterized protein n=1 Tax=Colletotrichum zoysiae TaxID=1216348 RepID=A0AAD9H2T9_9PEZI|nr:hypothetical protein LX32DRAFT_289833 [Colletotrichum zoysiae]